MGSSLSAAPHPLPLPSPLQWASIHKAGPNPPMNLFIASAASPRLASLLRLSFEKLSLLYHLPRLEDLCSNSASGVKGIGLPPFSDDLFASTFSFSLYFFDGGDGRKGPENQGISEFGPPKKKAFNGRRWTNILLAINVLAYVAQVASQGKLLSWGAKINSLIDKGQVWRLLTSSLLHANIGHLLVNCYSLNSIGPTVENLTGPRRFLAVYITSAIASSATSYWLCKAPAVGASGAIFGLVGSTAVFVIRHKGMIRGGKENLQYIAQVIFLNMVIGMLSKGIDNWGHLGGLLGGVATSWLLGPAWRYEPLSDNNRTRRFVDRAPIKYLTNGRKEPWHCS